jgi:glycosyltransferase involved in cell wall biosynthesis
MANVIQLFDSFRQGGTEWQTVQLTRLLHESGKHRLFLASLNDEGPLRAEVEKLGFHDIPSFPLQNFYNLNAAKQLSRLASFLRKNKIDLVHAHDFYTNIFGVAASRLAGVRACIASRRETEGLRSPSKRWVERRAFNAAAAVVANAEAIRGQLIAEGLPAPKVVTIHNGLNVAHVTPRINAQRADLLQSFNLPNGRRFVTIVANMRHVMKDQESFLRAAQLTRTALPDTSFILAGEGEQMPRLQQFAAELGLSDSAFFIGRCNRIGDLLAVSDVCVLSSRGVEGFSNSILEYMAAGRPVVATDVGGAREAVVNDETGYVVKPQDFQAMAEHLISLLRDPQKALAMGAQGRRRVVEQFSCEAQLKRVEELYAKLLK